MCDSRKRFNVNIPDEVDQPSQSLETGEVLFKKTTAAAAATRDEVSSINAVTSSSSTKYAPEPSGDGNNEPGSSQTHQNSQDRGPPGNTFGKSTYNQFKYLQNTDLYKLPPKPVAADPQQFVARNSNSIIVNSRQRGNPILKHVQNVPWEYGDIIPDYQIGERHCVLFLSLRYHNLNPEYIHERLKLLGNRYDLRVILVQVDNKNSKHNLKELGKICLLAGCTLVLAWSPEEAGRYLETYKQYENKPPDILQERVETDYFAKVQDILTTVKSINKTDAVTLLSNFGSMRNIINASKEDIEVCPGFGELKAQRLHKAFYESFKRTIDTKTQEDQALPESCVNQSKPLVSKLKRPSEHTFLQECLSNKEDSPPPSKKKRKSNDKETAGEDKEESPEPEKQGEYTTSELIQMIKNLPRVKNTGEEEQNKKRNIDDDGINMDDDSDTELELAIEASIAESNALTSPARKVEKSKELNRSSTSFTSKSDAIYKSGLSTSRHRKDSGSSGYQPSFEKESSRKSSSEKDKVQSNSSTSIDLTSTDTVTPNKNSKGLPSSSSTHSEEAAKCSSSSSKELSASNSARTSATNGKETCQGNSPSKKIISSNPVKATTPTKEKHVDKKIRHSTDRNILKSTDITRKTSLPTNIEPISNVSTKKIYSNTNKQIASKPLSETVNTIKHIAKNIDPSTGKARVGLHAKRKLNESVVVDASKERETYSQQITNDEFDDLVAHSSSEDDDDDDNN